jgi:hypothetical protein
MTDQELTDAIQFTSRVVAASADPRNRVEEGDDAAPAPRGITALATGQDRLDNAQLLRDLKIGRVYRISIRSRSKKHGDVRSLARFGRVRVIIDDSTDGSLVTVVFDQTNYDGTGNGRRFIAASYSLFDEPTALETIHTADAELRYARTGLTIDAQAAVDARQRVL